MLSKRLIVSIPLLLSILPSYGLSEPSNPTIDKRDAAVDVEVFQQLLNQVDPPALHSLLHEYSPKKFKHGMFMEDRIAVEAIHRDDPPLAASIVSLAKRQGGNGTVSTPASPSVPASSAIPSTSNPDQTSTSPPPDDTSATTTPGSDAASPTASSTDDQQPPPTGQTASTSASSSGDIETSSPSAGSVSTFTNSYGVIIVTTVGGGASTISTGSVPPSATNPSSTISATASTITSKSSHTSYVVHTTTLPNGAQSVVTSTAVVAESPGPTPTGDAGATVGTGTGTATPGLQNVNGGAVRTGSVLKEMLCVVGGAVGVAMLM